VATYAQLADVETASGAPIPAETSHDIQELLDEAEIQLAVYAGDLADRITAELTTADRVKSAVVGMVLREIQARRDRAAVLAGPTSTAAERVVAGMSVGRRERFLVGIPTAAWSVDMSQADYTLARPTRPAPPRRHWGRLWR
jgi:hypothetical protein